MFKITNYPTITLKNKPKQNEKKRKERTFKQHVLIELERMKSVGIKIVYN